MRRSRGGRGIRRELRTAPARTTSMRSVVLLVLASTLALAQDARQIVTRSLELDSSNERIARNYTFTMRQETRQLDSEGTVKSVRSRTEDVTLLDGSQYQRLIARDDKPLPPSDEKKEQEKLRKSIDERRKETEAQRAKRLADWEKSRRERHEPLLEIPDAFNLRIVGEEAVDGRAAWIIEATPRAGFEPKSRTARFFPKFKGRLWISKEDSVWVKAEAEALDTISIGWFLARLQKGARMAFEQTRVNGEVWLPKRMGFDVAARIALVKSIRASVNVTFTDYKKFQSDSRVVGFGAQE